jgi:enamine deaminase RidA (YjgF/YER057c/UK114 family)
MQLQSFNSPAAPRPPWGGYSQALLLTGASRFLFVSGQVPETADGSVPADFAGQCRLAWANVRAQLREAGMDLANLVKVTTYLSDRGYGIENRAIRNEVLGNVAPALTVVIVALFESRWLLEIEAIAAD